MCRAGRRDAEALCCNSSIELLPRLINSDFETLAHIGRLSLRQYFHSTFSLARIHDLWEKRYFQDVFKIPKSQPIVESKGIEEIHRTSSLVLIMP